MIIGVGSTKNSRCRVNFGTHNGIFHVDEVVGIAILEIMHFKFDSYVVRTRNPNEMKNLSVVIDIGGGQFDHHKAGFNVCRPTGEKYASAGLVWRRYGKWAIKSVIENENIILNSSEVQMIQEELDRTVIIPVDLEDNGVSVNTHFFSFVTKFLPSWMESENYDACFEKVEKIVFSILYELIKSAAVQVVTKRELGVRLASVKDGILEIPSQTMPWTEVVVEHNQTHDHNVKFVVFPYPAGGWAAQCVPPSMEKKFEQLVPFPANWAGGDASTLPRISGIHDATFCHNGCFFVRANSKKSVLEMCRIAMK